MPHDINESYQPNRFETKEAFNLTYDSLGSGTVNKLFWTEAEAIEARTTAQQLVPSMCITKVMLVKICQHWYSLGPAVNI